MPGIPRPLKTELPYGDGTCCDLMLGSLGNGIMREG